ncbi:MAG: proline dehydrogenase family protein [Chthonomonadales bacterium]
MSAGFARRFIAGERMEETVDSVRQLNAREMTVTLDYLGENVSRPEEAHDSVEYYRRLFKFIFDNRLDANVSLKLTQLGLDISDSLAAQNMRLILEEAAKYDQFVRIDMEGSDYTERTLSIFYELWGDHKNFGTVIQTYLYRSETDIHRLIDAGARVRLVKGAYNEPKEVAFPDKKDVDESYVKLTQELLLKGNYPAIATHDPVIIAATNSFVADNQISVDRFEYQMLFGVRRDLQNKLVSDGFRMRVYVPFGTQWYGYMMRRLAERPTNLWFVLKNLLRK